MRHRLGVGFALGLLVTLVAAWRVADAQTIVYEIPAAVAGNQAHGGALGHDFDVNVGSYITIDQLGVFDSNADGLLSPLNARLYNRNFQNAPVVSLNFALGNTGTLDGSQRFLPVTSTLGPPSPSTLVLPSGFLGTMVADGYSGVELNGNSNGANPGNFNNFDGTLVNGGGALSFLPTARYGNSAGIYPNNGDGPGPARYGAGTFRFTNTATAVNVGLTAATAQASQPGFAVGNMIDGNFGTGWAGDIAQNNVTPSNVAVFETTSVVSSPLGKQFQFTMTAGGGNAQHTPGRFRISATEDAVGTFADGLANGGDVTANWTPLDVVSAMSGDPGTTFTELADGSVLVGGANPASAVYTITANAPLLDAITGLRIEMLEDPSLPPLGVNGGPGRAPNGNFVFLEFSAIAVRDLTIEEVGVPEPASVIAWTIAGLFGVALVAYRRRKAARRV